MSLSPFSTREVAASRGSRSLLTFVLTGAVALGVTLPGVSHAVPGGKGWQGRYTLTIPTGQVDQFFHYACPAAYPVATSGGFLPNLAAKIGMVVLGDGPRLDITPVGYNEWSWIIGWPSGARAGSTISFDIYCVAGPA
ncbi:hypothetical protein [Pyxidicoccus sp. MSG2]|uniref:hypothetical protein n=1 Tax=Pyxidicoccus sp. MSG2 TaxID=2996790 RepID=UPI002270A23D|nr:hypothetical protein [Pyxidicoccus sp. MSG2]MCY1020052.1 hypothetical protein [Pyxidicoccus sp. MSG2]